MKSWEKKKHLDESQVVGVSLAVSVSDVTLNLLVSLLTGSAVMLAQALQGLSDMTTAGILYLGVKRSKREIDNAHPLGYGREIFFWSMIAAIIMFIGTGGLSFYFGWQQFKNPSPIDYGGVAILMLAFGMTTNFYAFSRSVKRLNQIEGESSWWNRILQSGMVETKATFTVDFMGTLAAMFGLVAIIAYLITGNPSYDGLGAMIIGISTMVAAILIMVDVHGLIVGRAVTPDTNKKITKTALKVEGVEAVVDLYSLYIGSDRLLIILEVHLADHLSTKKIEKIIDEIKKRVHDSIPAAHRVQIEVETPDDEFLAANPSKI